jgi:hypothetical protein
VESTLEVPGLALAATPAQAPRRASPWLLGGAGVLGVTASVFGGFALDARGDFDRTDVARDALAARDRYDRARFIAFGLLSTAVVAAGAGLWMWLRGH